MRGLTTLLLTAALLPAGPATAGAPRAAAPAAPAVSALITEKVRDNLWFIGGAGGNVTVHVGKEGVLIIDAGLVERSEELLAAIRALTPTPVSLIVNTHHHPDHVGGNAAISATGRHVNGGTQSVQDRAAIWAHENVQVKLSGAGGKPLIPEAGWPLETYFTAQQELYFNGEPIQLLYQPGAHTDGDTMVFFRRLDVLVTGDLYDTTGYPLIDLAAGGHIDGIIEGLNRIIDLTIPEANEEGGTMVIPGHGRLSDEYDVVVYRDALTVIRDRVKAMIDKGATLEQVQAARPSIDYDGRLGADRGAWTTAEFIAAVYQNLSTPR